MLLTYYAVKTCLEGESVEFCFPFPFPSPYRFVPALEVLGFYSIVGFCSTTIFY